MQSITFRPSTKLIVGTHVRESRAEQSLNDVYR